MPSVVLAIATAALESLSVSCEDVADEQADEIEAMEATADLEDCQAQNPDYIRLPPEPRKKAKLTEPDLEKRVEKASEYVIVPGTLHEYQQADDIDICTGKPKDPSIPRVTYARAQKMRAAVSHKFGREFKLGTQPWAESALIPGTYLGNPSLSVLVSQYMVSLRRRKVRAGEIVTSARAMDEATMKKLWEFNQNFPQESELQPNSRKRKHEHPELWAGYKIRQMLHALYTISMLCLLRYDEALEIMWSDLEYIETDGVPVLVLKLRFRKTDQTGGTTIQTPYAVQRHLLTPLLVC
ncbi:hypothetical protein BN946_scf184831.g1 [Trametes cinnabarina]|uniref:Tyr recombinase domain-containing protein n=1 Tax=Pycnoporus cinnabarinus TaxID=5643 RepID=A0A060SQE2_PYCCI|nr:hypothetical protein BN946_scf184972.g1 [Trametes cinnabarina]CDO74841.1 hypothetical protein BN946_scf184280.g1 [Trametes cinnabarina]CDO76565.1 hypothetical protein BN946_scf184831.g1 [Trametes cinnabarina]